MGYAVIFGPKSARHTVVILSIFERSIKDDDRNNDQQRNSVFQRPATPPAGLFHDIVTYQGKQDCQSET